MGDRLLHIHGSLGAAGPPHAFGGAIGLAYCTREPRGGRDLHVNVVVLPDRAGEVLADPPDGVTVGEAGLRAAEGGG